MPTLYVENVPEELYEALRGRAQRNGKSITAEVISLLRENVPTEAELAQRARLLKLARRLQATKPADRGPFPSAEEMQREDRNR